MKYTKHWKLEIYITILSLILIPLIYFLFSPFFGQLIFVPLIFGMLPIFLIRRYKYLFYYPLGVSLVYSFYLLILSWSWPLDLSLIPMAFASILIPTLIGYAIGFFVLKHGKPDQKWLIPIHCLTIFILVYLVAFLSVYLIANSWLVTLSTSLLYALIFGGSQALTSYLYPSNRFSPIVNAVLFQLIYGFTGHSYFSFVTLINLAFAYGAMYLIVTKIKKQQFP